MRHSSRHMGVHRTAVYWTCRATSRFRMRTATAAQFLAHGLMEGLTQPTGRSRRPPAKWRCFCGSASVGQRVSFLRGASALAYDELHGYRMHVDHPLVLRPLHFGRRLAKTHEVNRLGSA